MYRAHYHDGRQAVRRSVRIEVSPSHLIVRSPEGGRITVWSLEQLKVQPRDVPGAPLRLTHPEHPNAVVTVEKPKKIRPVLRKHGGIDPGGWLRNCPLYVRSMVWGGLSLAALGVWVGLVVLGSRPLARSIPHRWSRWLGDRASRAILSQHPLCGDTEAKRILDRMKRRLTPPGYPHRRFRVQVLDAPRVNAVAAPGGRIIVFNGLFGYTRTPDEFAGILAHEMAHVIERHPSQHVLRSLGFGVLFGSFTGNLTTAGQIAQVLTQQAFTREDEIRADRLGVNLLNRANVSSKGLVRFLKRLRRTGLHRTGVFGYLSSHPPYETRIEQLRPRVQQADPVLTRTSWDKLKRICGSAGRDSSRAVNDAIPVNSIR